MNARYYWAGGLAAMACALLGAMTAQAQITSNAGDGVLNAPYRGTITSLREATMDLGYGEVMTQVEPHSSSLTITGTVYIWHDLPTGFSQWDRSVLRMYRGLDAGGYEVDLSGATSEGTAVQITSPDTIERFSFRAMGTKTLANLRFRVHLKYQTNSGTSNHTHDITVAPMTATFLTLPGESEAFHYGVPLLDVAVGAARLVVRTGQTADTIGATYFYQTTQGPSAARVPRYDVVLPGAAESVFIQHKDQFRLGASPFSKLYFGTPWPGHLIGYYVQGDVRAPGIADYDIDQGTQADGFNRVNRVRPNYLGDTHPATLQYTYDGNNRATSIRDGASPNNVITLTRSGATGYVESITTSDGRSWTIQSDVPGRITGVVPVASGAGARYFKYVNSADPATMYRITQVRLGASNGGDPFDPDLGDEIMYKFVYDSSGDLLEEWRYVDGQLRKTIEHVVVSEFERQRKEWFGTGGGDYRLTRLQYDSTQTPYRLNHRLASMTTYSEPASGGTPYLTVYTHNVGEPGDHPNLAGTMVLARVDLPDGTWLTYEYDAHTDTQSRNFGLRSKTTHAGADGSLITYDVTYELFYRISGNSRLFPRPRIAKVRDGRHDPDDPGDPNDPVFDTEVTFDYENGNEDENGDGWNGEDSGQLFRRTGPTITNVDLTTRTPETRYYYYTNADPDPNVRRVLKRVETDYASGLHRDVAYQYDSLLRRRFETVAPSGANLVTEYQYTDNLPTQDRVVIDADGYWTKTQFDPDGRVWKVIRYIDPGGGSGNYYQTENVYDVHGRLYQQLVDNKDQDGVPIVGESAQIVTQYTYDRLGRLTLRAVDPSGINQLANFAYNWLGQTTREYDSTGRGVKRVFDGRGLVNEEIPLAAGQVETPALHTLFTYDANGRVETLTKPTGAAVQKVYDSFGRLRQDVRLPSAGPVTNNAAVYEYDNASHVTRTTVRDNVTVGQPNTGTVISDTTAQYDEGGFNYETRQRLVAGTNSNDDPLTQRKFDWAGNVTEEKSLGDSTVADRTITTIYETAGRVEKVQDSLGGETWYHDRDGRGNVEELWVKLQGSDYAVTSTLYDALSRAIRVTDPEDATGLRHYRQRFHDSRGNLRRETARNSAGIAKQTTIWDYDNASRLEFQAVLANPAGTQLVGEDVDRVVRYQYWDADGRLRYRTTYNANTTAPRQAETTYDALGRVEYTYDAAREYTKNVYATNGRLDHREIWDGVGTRTVAFGYDGQDRVSTQTAQGGGQLPDLVTSYQYDALDRPIRVGSPRVSGGPTIFTRTDYDLAGQRVAVVENEGGGVLERLTEYDYNRLNQLILQTAHNWDSAGGNATTQLTKYRWDPLGRLLRTVYPDSTASPDDGNCVDCVRMAYDLAGRMTSRHIQRPLDTSYTYDDRGLVLTRTTTGYPAEAFGYDALDRLIAADRGSTTIDRDYTALGDLDYEIQAIAGGTPRTVDYTHDQAGNVTQLTYPNATTVTYTHTPLNLVAAMALGSQVNIEYQYFPAGPSLPGRMLEARRTTTNAGNVVYDTGFGYDVHRRTNLIDNSVEISGTPQAVATYQFTHDLHGNPLTQTAAGDSLFAGDDRDFTLDNLDRLIGTDYAEFATPEASTLDLLGNRESQTDRNANTTAYGAVNAANEYSTVGGQAVSYDATGNLTVDEAGRQYVYDEQNRLTEVRDAGSTVLATYAYDALGRRVTATIGGATTRFYYDGQRVIEERNAADAAARYHVNGGQFIDERVATYATATGQFEYYLHGANFSVVGVGDSSGSTITRLDYTAGGAGASVGAPCRPCDTNCDGSVNGSDIQPFIGLLLGSGTPCSTCAGDTNCDGSVNGSDIQPFVDCLLAGQGFACEDGPAPPTGSFALHGRPIDVLPDGKVLMDFRTRIYDPQHGRWLQRDRSGYTDGPNLYEAFRANAQRFTDPDARYTRLASGWDNGDQVLYQRFPWLWSDEPSDSFSVGRYYQYKGEKVVLFDQRWDEYAYAMPFAAVEQWSRGVHSEMDYTDFVHRYGTQIDRATGKAVRRRTLDELVIAIQDEMAAHTFSLDFFDPVVFFGGPAFTTLTAETAPGLFVEDTRTVSRLEYGLSVGTTVLQVVPVAQFGARSLSAGTAVATRGFPVVIAEGTPALGALPRVSSSAPVLAGDLRTAAAAGQLARSRVWSFGNLPPGVLGTTDKYGNVVIQSGLRGSVLRETVRHEAVHRFLSPRSGPFLSLRADLRMAGYRHSHLLRYLEEAAAESYGAGSVRQGLVFPLQADYGLSGWRIGGEGALYIGGTAAGSYLVYEGVDELLQP